MTDSSTHRGEGRVRRKGRECGWERCVASAERVAAGARGKSYSRAGSGTVSKRQITWEATYVAIEVRCVARLFSREHERAAGCAIRAYIVSAMMYVRAGNAGISHIACHDETHDTHFIHFMYESLYLYRTSPPLPRHGARGVFIHGVRTAGASVAWLALGALRTSSWRAW